jgi:hypothetical protein
VTVVTVATVSLSQMSSEKPVISASVSDNVKDQKAVAVTPNPVKTVAVTPNPVAAAAASCPPNAQSRTTIVPANGLAAGSHKRPAPSSVSAPSAVLDGELRASAALLAGDYADELLSSPLKRRRPSVSANVPPMGQFTPKSVTEQLLTPEPGRLLAALEEVRSRPFAAVLESNCCCVVGDSVFSCRPRTTSKAEWISWRRGSSMPFGCWASSRRRVWSSRR